ncbi:MAG: hypothetical protein GXO48_01865 [Chlorobi bacterium]|nr:hypothetical protein [Chlorobiota bacterium]
MNLHGLRFFIVLSLFGISITSCRKDPQVNLDSSSNPSVVLIVWDGIRLEDMINSDGSLREDIVPFMKQLSVKSNSFYTARFHHQGYTYTMAGHLALLTGQHFPVKNDMSGTAPVPTILHRILHDNQVVPEKTWIVATKSKICSLNNCEDSICQQIPVPSGMCGLYGVWGPIDSRTFQASVDVIKKHKPMFLLVSFSAPDIIAHTGDYEGYIKAIKQADHYTSQLYSFVSSLYEDSVMFVITTDHGRHDYDYTGHGDKCPGCTSLFLLINFPFQNNVEKLFDTYSKNTIVHRDLYCLTINFLSINTHHGFCDIN